MNIVDIAAGSEDFSILVTALNTAGLTDTVRAADDITVFAPTNAAFAALATDLGFEGDPTDADAVFGFIAGALTDLGGGDPIPLLTDILLYHVAPGARTEPTITGSEGIATLLEGAEIAPSDGALGDLEPDLADPRIVAPDIAADNGIIQGIDRVLLPIDIPGNTPPDVPNIVDIAAGSDDFNILVMALNTAGLTDTVRTSTDITVFAPTDAAFTALAVDLGFDGDQTDESAVFGFIAQALTDLGGGDPIPLLTDILLYHVSGGAKSEADITAAGSVATLLTGATIAPSGGALVDGEPDLLDPVIVVPDVAASNGTIQGIDRVLLPIDIAGNDRMTLTEIVAASGGTFDSDASDFDLLLNALQAAGLVGALDNPDSNLTVFAPNDAAFVAAAQALGYEGSDEAGAFEYIVDAVTLLSFGRDPVPLLSDILLYHVAPGALDSGDVLGSASIDTLLGAALGVDGAALVDGEPNLPDANIIATDIAASNGFVHVIDGVLVPVDLLPSNGAEDAVAFVIGDDTAETFTLGDNDDYVSAGGGDDTILGDDGSDVILGGDGEDTAVISGDFNDFEFLFGPNGVAATDKTDVAQGTDFLKDVEFVRFDDGTLDLSVLTGAAQLAPDQLQILTELYIAYFDRAPDAGGLLFWGTSLANGVSLPEIAALFFEQQETHEALPEDLTAEAFVTQAYNNFLERDPDAEGLNFWVSVLEAGTVTRPEFMLALIEGARADSGSPDDVRTIEDKGDIGVSFALINGLNNVDDAGAVMAAYMLEDRAAGLAEAQTLITEAAADANGADGSTEFTFQLAGVIDDPFAVA